MTHYLSDEERSELEHSYLYSMARNINGKSFEEYVAEIRPFEDGDNNEYGVDKEREGHYDYMLRRYREEEDKGNKELGKTNYNDAMQAFMDNPTKAVDSYFDAVEDANDPILRKMLGDVEEIQMADEREHYVSGNHYNDVVPGMQYMEMMQYMLDGKTGVEAHLLGQVYKYLMRAGKKDDYEQDLRKASWYTNCLAKYISTGEVSADDNDIIKLMTELTELRKD